MVTVGMLYHKKDRRKVKKAYVCAAVAKMMAMALGSFSFMEEILRIMRSSSKELTPLLFFWHESFSVTSRSFHASKYIDILRLRFSLYFNFYRHRRFSRRKASAKVADVRIFKFFDRIYYC